MNSKDMNTASNIFILLALFMGIIEFISGVQGLAKYCSIILYAVFAVGSSILKKLEKSNKDN